MHGRVRHALSPRAGHRRAAHRGRVSWRRHAPRAARYSPGSTPSTGSVQARAPIMDLRDNRPAGVTQHRSAPEVLQAGSILCARVLPKPNPGSTTIRVARDPRLQQAATRSGKKAGNLRNHILIVRRVLHAAGPTLHMHQADRHRQSRGRLQRARLAAGQDIVDHSRPGRDRLAHHLRLAGIDGDRQRPAVAAAPR